MKNITKSLVVITAVAALVIGGTVAWFSDTEIKAGNTFTAGTIDIAVDNENPWTSTTPYELKDMKPSQVDYTNFTIKNVGSNPANVWKKVNVTSTDDNGISEPECDAYGGDWDGTSCSGGNAVNDIDKVIEYDLSVKVKDADGTVVWDQTLYNLDKTIAEINGQNTFLGMIPVGWSMDVTESYHMMDSAGNEYQSDKMTFGIELTAEQLKGTAILEDKNPSNWRVRGETAYQGTLSYGVKDSKFNFSFNGKAPLPSTSYSLITYPESFSTPAMTQDWPRKPIVVLGTSSSDANGDVNISGSFDLGSIKNMKVWLVKSDDVTGDQMSGWHPYAYLFDTGLIDYYKSN